MTVIIDGVVKERVDSLRIGQRVDLENDMFADPGGYATASGQFADDATEHPQFAFEFETVLAITRETSDCIRIDFETVLAITRETSYCIRIDFESGLSCGFPVDHLVGIDGEQS